MEAYEDPKHEGNSDDHLTGLLCITGCGRAAGTAWSPHWCFECNVDRMRRITKKLEELTAPAREED